MKKYCRVWLSFLVLILFPISAFAQPTLQFDEKTGLFKVRNHTLDVVNASFVFWHDKWQWSGVRVRGKTSGAKTYQISGKSKKTGLLLNGSVTSPAPNELTWQFDAKVLEKWHNRQWGGISFKINSTGLKQEKFSPAAILLPNNEGWSLKLQPDQSPMKVRFEPPIGDILFERGNRSEIRAYFILKDAPTNDAQLKMTVTLPQEGKVIQTAAERLAKPSSSKWYRNLISWNHSPVDLSFLNKDERPAGKHGFLKATGENLIFEDGTKARFWGTNLSAYSLFMTSESNMRSQAKRLSQLGFNLVRFHHHDSIWVRRNIFGNRADNTLSLDQWSLGKLDLWIKILRDEGIYVWLDLMVGREFTNKDRIRNFEEIAKGKKSKNARGFSYINPDIQNRMQEFAEAYLNHVNPYTALTYKDDPAIVGVLITNENDLTHHFGNTLLPDKKVPEHNKIYMSLAREFALKNGLDGKKTWRSWEFGSSKLFLNDLEHRFNQKMIRQLEKQGVKVPIVTTNSWGGMSLAGLPSLADGGVIDAHSYGEADALSSNPRYRSNFAHWISAASVAGKPLTVTEWNVSPFPAFDRFIIPTYLASLASLQDWDAMMQYAYAQVPLNKPGAPSNWHAFNDPSMLAMMPAAALLYRRGHVKQAKKLYHLRLPPDVLMGQNISPITSKTIRTLAEQSRLRIALPKIKELPWLKPSGKDQDAIIVSDFNRDFLPKQQGFICSDTKEICRDWRSGVATINTPKSQVASGWVGGRSIELDNISLNIETANASIAVQSLDSAPISKSGKILISMSAQSVPEKHGKLPFLSEPVEGVIHIQAQTGLKLYALSATRGKREIFPERANGKYVITLDEKFNSYWLLLE